MRAIKITLFLITATLFQTPSVHAADHRILHHQLSPQTHLHHLEASFNAHHPEHLYQPISSEVNAPQSSPFSLASYLITLFGHTR